MPNYLLSLRNAIIVIALYAGLALVNGVLLYANTAIAPALITQSLSTARQMGQARLTVYGFSIYDAKLWASDGFVVSNYAAEPFALELRYLRSFKGTMIAERSLSEMRRLGAISDEKAGKWLDNMKKTFPDVKKGDELIGIHKPDGTASFTLNGKPIGEVRDEEFTRLFFGIWLSPNTSEPKMRMQLLGSAAVQSKPK